MTKFDSILYSIYKPRLPSPIAKPTKSAMHRGNGRDHVRRMLEVKARKRDAEVASAKDYGDERVRKHASPHSFIEEGMVLVVKLPGHRLLRLKVLSCRDRRTSKEVCFILPDEDDHSAHTTVTVNLHTELYMHVEQDCGWRFR
jgi:hypothetical protein